MCFPINHQGLSKTAEQADAGHRGKGFASWRHVAFSHVRRGWDCCDIAWQVPWPTKTRDPFSRHACLQPSMPISYPSGTPAASPVPSSDACANSTLTSCHIQSAVSCSLVHPIPRRRSPRLFFPKGKVSRLSVRSVSDFAPAKTRCHGQCHANSRAPQYSIFKKSSALLWTSRIDSRRSTTGSGSGSHTVASHFIPPPSFLYPYQGDIPPCRWIPRLRV
jgi:hypothetical protein